jgi:hypothetical protein
VFDMSAPRGPFSPRPPSGPPPRSVTNRNRGKRVNALVKEAEERSQEARLLAGAKRLRAQARARGASPGLQLPAELEDSPLPPTPPLPLALRNSDEDGEAAPPPLPPSFSLVPTAVTRRIRREHPEANRDRRYLNLIDRSSEGRAELEGRVNALDSRPRAPRLQSKRGLIELENADLYAEPLRLEDRRPPPSLVGPEELDEDKKWDNAAAAAPQDPSRPQWRPTPQPPPSTNTRAQGQQGQPVRANTSGYRSKPLTKARNSSKPPPSLSSFSSPLWDDGPTLKEYIIVYPPPRRIAGVEINPGLDLDTLGSAAINQNTVPGVVRNFSIEYLFTRVPNFQIFSGNIKSNNILLRGMSRYVNGAIFVKANQSDRVSLYKSILEARTKPLEDLPSEVDELFGSIDAMIALTEFLERGEESNKRFYTILRKYYEVFLRNIMSGIGYIITNGAPEFKMGRYTMVDFNYDVSRLGVTLANRIYDDIKRESRSSGDWNKYTRNNKEHVGLGSTQNKAKTRWGQFKNFFRGKTLQVPAPNTSRNIPLLSKKNLNNFTHKRDRKHGELFLSIERFVGNVLKTVIDVEVLDRKANLPVARARTVPQARLAATQGLGQISPNEARLAARGGPAGLSLEKGLNQLQEKRKRLADREPLILARTSSPTGLNKGPQGPPATHQEEELKVPPETTTSLIGELQVPPETTTSLIGEPRGPPEPLPYLGPLMVRNVRGSEEAASKGKVVGNIIDYLSVPLKMGEGEIVRLDAFLMTKSSNYLFKVRTWLAHKGTLNTFLGAASKMNLYQIQTLLDNIGNNERGSSAGGSRKRSKRSSKNRTRKH